MLNSEAVKSFFGFTEKARELELGAASLGGSVPLAEADMLSLFSCPSCQTSNRLHFNARSGEDLCRKCGHDRRQVIAQPSGQSGLAGDSKADTLLPISIAIVMLLVFCVFVFWVALAR